MAGMYGQAHYEDMIQEISVAAGDQLLTQGGISFQLFPERLPTTAEIEIQVIYRTENFGGVEITIKGILATAPNLVTGTQVFSQTVDTDDYQDTGKNKISTPGAARWLNLVTNNPNARFGADIDEVFVFVNAVPAAGSGLILAF